VSRGPSFLQRVLASLEWRLGLRILWVISRDMTRSGPPQGSGLRFRQLGEAEALSIAADPAMDLRPAWVRQVLRLPGGCTAAFRGDKAVAYVWFAFESAPDREGLWACVPGGAVYRYKAFVRPELRSEGIGRDLNRFTDGMCVEGGRTTALSYIAAHNARSLASSKATGSRVVGCILAWRLLGKPLVLYSPGARASGLRIVDRPPGHAAALDATITQL
jgi:hypothetical protein